MTSASGSLNISLYLSFDSFQPSRTVGVWWHKSSVRGLKSNLKEQSNSVTNPKIYVDADACPVKEEVLKVAERHGFSVYYVSNAYMRLPKGQLVNQVVVSDSFDAADDWIAENVTSSDIVVTADIPLAHRCLGNQALVVNSNGREFTEASIGQALAGRAISQHLREMGVQSSQTGPYSKQERSIFLQKLEILCRRARNLS